MLLHIIFLFVTLLQQTQEDEDPVVLSLYHTKHRSLTSLYGHCFYTYELVSKSSIPPKPAWQLLPYCVWPYNLKIKDQNLNTCRGLRQERYTFKYLRHLGISSSQLFDWNSDIDLVDLYQLYIVHNFQQFENETICRCLREFGDRCEYHIADSMYSVTDIDTTGFEDIRALFDDTQAEKMLTCYVGLPTCISAVPCLDWRQLCDGVVDCLNGEDEERCSEMEMNECDNGIEFRCKDGRCIPKEFAFDRVFDCLDHSDEQELVGIDTFQDCTINPSIECEQRNRAWHQFSCSDGEIIRYPMKTCQTRRDWLFFKHFFGNESTSALSSECYNYMICKTAVQYGADRLGSIGHLFCEAFKHPTTLVPCPPMFFFPSNPVLFPFVKFLFLSNLTNPAETIHLPTYICYYDYMCPEMKFSMSVEMNNTSYRCIQLKKHHLFKFINHWYELFGQMYILFSSCHASRYENASCVLYQCAESSKYIAKHRLKDGVIDCYMEDDEDFSDSCSLNLPNRFQCFSNPKECIERHLLLNSVFDCSDGSDELYQFACKQSDDYGCKLLRGDINSLSFGSYLFQELCNGIRWGLITINNETDETSCAQWPYICDSPYVLCDSVWNCKDGRDEVNCSSNIMPLKNCTEHYCRDMNNQSSLKCLPLKKAGDNTVDCLGETDERYDGFCSKKYPMNLRKRYRCDQSDICIDPIAMCNGLKDCPNLDDESLCPWMFNENVLSNTDFRCQNKGHNKTHVSRCDGIKVCDLGEDEWLCNIVEKRSDKPFLLNNIIKTKDLEISNQQGRKRRSSISQDLLNDIDECRQSCTPTIDLFGPVPITNTVECCKDCRSCILATRLPDTIKNCHRGIIMSTYTSSMNIPDINRCFCPSAYWGETCEYQSERISIILRIETNNDYNTIKNRSSALIFFISLLHENDTAMLLDSEQLSVSHYAQANQKHFIYLRYPRPKPPGQYFVKIDSYISNMAQAMYTGKSWLYNVQFSFLPVGRLAVRLTMSDTIDKAQKSICKKFADKSNGRCLTYMNNDTRMFFSCDDGWAGEYCEQKGNHFCPNGSQCAYDCDKFETARCICPLGQIGAHCSVVFNPCLNVLCENGGTCVPLDERSFHYFCACDAEFFGTKCENTASKMTIIISSSFFSVVSTIPAVVVHFGVLKESMNGMMIHRNQFLFTNLDLTNSQLIIYDEQYKYLPTFILLQVFSSSQPYYGMFYMIEFLQNNRLENLNSSATASKRCPHVSELLDNTINGYTPLKRVKYYHQICTVHSPPICFFDDAYMCFCDHSSRADCLIFDFDNIDCRFCQNQGRCITVQQQMTCVCPECYYGSLCQFTLLKYSATFDSLLSSTTVKGTTFSQTPIVIKVTSVLVSIMILVGLIGNSICFLVFSNKNAHETGCGYYLLCLSIINQIALFILGVKFLSIIIMPLSSLSACIVLEFLLKYFLHVSDWFTVAVGIERAITVVKGVSFDKERSVKITKFVIITILLSVTISLVHTLFIYELVANPFSLNRFSCTKVMNSRIVEIYEPTINIVQLIFPIFIHTVSTLTFIINMARRKSSSLTYKDDVGKKTFRHIFKEQVVTYKPFIIGPLFIVCLSLPRLIVSFAFACIRHSWQQYLYLAGYLVSFVPLTGTFFIFVLPSPTYRKILTDKFFHK